LEAIQKAAEVLALANNPAILAGSRVTERGAMTELGLVADILGTPVITESGTTHGRLAFPSDHPLNGQGLPLWSPEVRQRLQEHDVILVVGMDLLRQYIYAEPSRAIPEHIRLMQTTRTLAAGKTTPWKSACWRHRESLQELFHSSISS
jgi:thiamine pyrophosphate-dependent acetolactate synthase large subunit-like protein